jgi:hypothetical protein
MPRERHVLNSANACRVRGPGYGMAYAMSWIESHDSLYQHPKLEALSAAMGWDIDLTFGKVHRFWHWCSKYAECGDLRKFSDQQLGRSVGLVDESASKFVKEMKINGWLDRKPYFRVHDWWDYIGPWLRSKYKRSPEKWQAVRSAYRPGELDEMQPLRNGYATANQPNQPTNQPSRVDRVKQRLRQKNAEAEKPKNGELFHDAARIS